jgi:hypothetical protein
VTEPEAHKVWSIVVKATDDEMRPSLIEELAADLCVVFPEWDGLWRSRRDSWLDEFFGPGGHTPRTGGTP